MAQSQATTAEKPFKRLPVDVLPRNYRLELKPDLTAFTFQGSLEITAEVYRGNERRNVERARVNKDSGGGEREGKKREGGDT